MDILTKLETQLSLGRRVEFEKNRDSYLCCVYIPLQHDTIKAMRGYSGIGRTLYDSLSHALVHINA